VPMLYFIAAFVVRLSGMAWPMSEAVHAARQQLVGLLEPILAGVGNNAQLSLAVYRSLGAMLVPSIVLVLIVWLAVRRTYLRAGVGGMLLSLGTREPRPGDLEERRLVNVADEMAIAAGVPPPRVRVLDTPVSNAAVIGASIEDAWVVVTRGLLDNFNREEVEGIVGHLIGSVGNGDLRLSITILSVFQTAWLLCAVLDAPFHRKSRGAVWQFVKLVFARRGTEGAARDADRVIETLGANLGSDDRGSSAATLLSLPLWLFRFGVSFYVALICGPFVATIWRARRHLADATAVQLTRDPDGLASALRKWQQLAIVAPGGAWASHFFIVSGPGHSKENRLADSGFGYFPLTPPLDRRIARLEAQGAAVASRQTPAAPKVTILKLIVFAVLIGPLLALLFGLLFLIIFAFNFLFASVCLVFTALILK
jgi:Zn-dependent protease with chaperone function